MKRTDLSVFLHFGESLGELRKIAANMPWIDFYTATVNPMEWLRRFIHESKDIPFSDTRTSAESLLALLTEATKTPSDVKRSITSDEAVALFFAVQNFLETFDREHLNLDVFMVTPKGIYSSRMLVDKSEEHFPPSIISRLPKQAKTDIHASGRCLAFDLPTSCAFHVWRALEIVFGAYYVSITGRTFDDDKVTRNWGKYIEALGKVGADKDIVANLDHIRKTYRNPTMHPNENLTEEEAFSLFGLGIAAINQVMLEIDKQPHAAKAYSI